MKYNNYFRIMALLLAVMMILSVLSACGSTDDNTGKKEPDQTESRATENNTDTDTPAADEEPTVDNKTAIKNALSANGENDIIEQMPQFPEQKDVEGYYINVSLNGQYIIGMVFLPDDFQTEKYPAMICLPRNVVDDYERFTEAAYRGAVVFVAAPGHGGGEVVDFGGDEDLNYLSDVIDLVYNCDFVDNERIMLFGTKEHSICVLRYISENYQDRKPVKAAAVVDPIHDLYKIYSGLDDSWMERMNRYTGGTPEEVPEEYDKRSPGLLAENVDVPLYIAYFDVPDESGTGSFVRFGGLDSISYYEEYINKLKSLGKDVTAVHYDEVDVDLDHEQFVAMADWFIGLK